jgi:hypothetical protein
MSGKGSAHSLSFIHGPRRHPDLVLLIIDLKDRSVPEEFAGVMCALWDHEYDRTRADIIDNMITIGFKQTSASMQAEQKWSMRVKWLALMLPIYGFIHRQSI